MNLQAQPSSNLSSFGHNKQIPEAIAQQVLKALSFYPELRETRIRFVLKNKIKGSVMQAQPVFHSLLRNRAHRSYRINISRQFHLINTHMPITDIPEPVLVGWIGHELGHILDYEGKTNGEMVAFGYHYYLYDAFVKEAERVADTLAVQRGMGRYILATKRFILDHASLPQAYKDKIARLYLSPDVIMEQVQQLETKAEQKGQ